MSAKFVYVSSSAVFDGLKGNYKETDAVSATSTFGKMKAAGENIVRSRAGNAAVLRLSPLVGSSHPWRPTLFDRIRAALSAGERVELFDDEWHSWAPVSAAVEAIEAAIDRAPKGSLFHYGGLTRLTPFEIGRMFATATGFDPDLVQARKRPQPKSTPADADAQRWDYSLNSSEIIRALGVSAAPIEKTFEAEFRL
jgi:dTDP-4-dehydrorhamnose reductase